MKAKRVLPHLVETVHKLVECEPCEAVCKAEIKRSVFVPLAETDWIPGDRNSGLRSRDICRECQKVVETREEPKEAISRYLVLEAERSEIEAVVNLEEEQ